MASLPPVAVKRHTGVKCRVCHSPHRTSVEFELLQGASNAAMAKKYGFSQDGVRRHRMHQGDRTNAIVAASKGTKTPEADALSTAQRDMANTLNAVRRQAQYLMDEADMQYQRFKNTDSAQDIVALLKLNLSAMQELGKLVDAYPRANAVPVPENHLHLHGLSQSDLTDLIAGLKKLPA